MGSEWTQCRLDKIVEITSSKRVMMADYVTEGIPFYRSKEIIERSKGNYVSTELFITEKSYETFRSKFGAPKTGEILLTSVGTLGIPYQVEEGDKFYFKDGNLTWFRNFHESINPDFLYYWLLSPRAQQKIDEISIGSTQKALTISALKSLEIKFPSIAAQKNIVRILRDLDKKLAVNRQTNQTLEKIAQALFKSWFVDFEPTRAKIAAKEAGASPEEIERAAMCAISGKTPDQLAQLPPETQQTLKTTAALFPDALVDSELGEIPAGWEVKSFGDVSNCFDSKRVPLSKPQREKKKPGDYPYYGATSVMDYVNEWIFDGIYLLLGEDGSVAKEDGTPFSQYVWGKTWVNNHAHVLQGKDTVSTEHLMLFIQTQNIAAYITGAVQQKLNQGNMNSIPFIFADRQINEAFFQSIKSLYAQVRNLTEEIQRLENLKNLLLPKLLSGEIDLNSNFSVEE